jgi:hypothetical protein
MGALVASPPDSAMVTEVRFAESASGTRTTRWASLHVVGSPTALAWIVPVTGGAVVDGSSDAWMEALEAASAPRVVPPAGPPPCGQAGGVDVEGELDRVATVPPTSIALAPDSASLAAVLAMWGLSATPQVSTALAAAATPGTTFVVLGFANPPVDMWTRTVRVVDASPPDISLSLVLGASPATAVTAYVFSPAGVAIAGGAPRGIDPASIFRTGYGGSNYAALAAKSLYSAPGTWLVDTSGHQVLFEGAALPGGQVIDGLDTAYFSRAASYGDLPDSTACLRGAATDSLATSPVAYACPAGALASVGVDGCQEKVGAGEVDPGTLRCGGIADDLAIALSGLTPATTWLTRARSVIPADSFGSNSTVESAGTPPSGPVYVASDYALSCIAPVVTPSPAPLPAANPTSTGQVSSPDNGAGSGASDVVGSVADAAASSDSCSCGSDPGSEDSSSSDSCGGDSGSSDSSGGCSGGSGATPEAAAARETPDRATARQPGAGPHPARLPACSSPSPSQRRSFVARGARAPDHSAACPLALPPCPARCPSTVAISRFISRRLTTRSTIPCLRRNSLL